MAQAGCDQPRPERDADRRGDDRRVEQKPLTDSERRAQQRRSGRDRRGD